MLLVVALAWLATAPALDGGFVYDDHHYLVDNPSVSGDAPVWTRPLGEPLQGLWRPLTVASWRMQWSPGTGAGPFRALNVALHAAVALLVVAVARALGCSRTGATLAGILFAVHPAHAEAVAWVTGRAELLAALLVLAAWWCHLRRGTAASLAAPLLVALACLSKENALVAPVLFAAADVLLGRRPPPWARWGTLGLAALAVLAAREAVLPQALPGDGPFDGAGAGARVAIALNVLGLSLRVLAWPHPLRVDYHRDEVALLRPELLAAVLLGVTLVLLLLRRRRPLPAAGLLLTGVALLPVLHLLPIGEPFAERFLYLPSVPFCIALGALLGEALSRSAASRNGLGGALALAGGLVLAALPASRAATAVFRDDMTLWRNAVAVAPDLPLPRYNLGRELLERGEVLTRDHAHPGAADLLASSLALEPRHVYAGLAHQMLGDVALGLVGPGPAEPQRAARHYRAAADALPGLIEPRLRLAELSVAAPAVVPVAEALAVLSTLEEGGLDAIQAERVQALRVQISGLSSPADEATGTSSPDGS